MSRTPQANHRIRGANSHTTLQSASLNSLASECAKSHFVALGLGDDVRPQLADPTTPSAAPALLSKPFQRPVLEHAHLSAEIALSRALTEAAQSRLTFIAGSRDDIYPATYQSMNSLGHRPSVGRPTRHFEKRPSVPLGATFEGDLQTTFRLLGAAGFRRVIAVDLTQPEFGIPVVMVLIPGMREED